MPITQFTTYPSSNNPGPFATEMDQMISEIPSRIAEANAMEIAGTLSEVQDTSTTSNAIGTGTKTFTVTAGKSFALGMTLLIADTAAPSTNSMLGTVTSYSGATLVMNIETIKGSGTKTAWTISQSAPGGATLGANTFTGNQTFAETTDTVFTITDGAAFEIDPTNGNIQTVTLGDNRTPAATNFAARQAILLGENDGSAYAITWTTVAPTWVKAGGTASAPTLATTGYTWILFWKVGAVIYAAEAGKP